MDNKDIHSAEQEWEIDLYDLFYLFRQKLINVILAFALGGVLVGAFTFFFITPKFEATAKLYIVSASNDSVVNLSDLQIGASLTADYKELVLSRPMLESVMQNIKPNVEDIEKLEKMITVSNPSNTRILSITATSTSPQEAKDIANEMARLAVDWLPEVMESNSPNIAEEAIIPEKKASPSYIKNTIIGAFAFAILYYGWVVLQYLNNDTIRSEEEMEKYFGIIPLAAIPEENITDLADDGEDSAFNRITRHFDRKGER